MKTIGFIQRFSIWLNYDVSNSFNTTAAESKNKANAENPSTTIMIVHKKEAGVNLQVEGIRRRIFFIYLYGGANQMFNSLLTQTNTSNHFKKTPNDSTAFNDHWPQFHKCIAPGKI